jgi:hypothetical protein
MYLRVLSTAVMLLAGLPATPVHQVNYGALWDGAMPFDRFLSSVRSREAQWKSRFANAAIDADAITRARALKERRRILVIAEDRCHDSAWAVPYIAKLAAAVPERLELRVISRQAGSDVREYRTPDGRVTTPTVIILDESNRPLAGWAERPSELHAWVIGNKASLSSEELRAKIEKWYTEDAGKSTVREIVDLLEKRPAEGR